MKTLLLVTLATILIAPAALAKKGFVCLSDDRASGGLLAAFVLEYNYVENSYEGPEINVWAVNSSVDLHGQKTIKSYRIENANCDGNISSTNQLIPNISCEFKNRRDLYQSDRISLQSGNGGHLKFEVSRVSAMGSVISRETLTAPSTESCKFVQVEEFERLKEKLSKATKVEVQTNAPAIDSYGQEPGTPSEEDLNFFGSAL